MRIDGVESVKSADEKTAAATVLSPDEIIIEGKKTGEGVINVNTRSGKETIIVTVKKRSRSETMIEIDVQILEIIHTSGADYGIDWPALISGQALPKGGLPLSPLNVVEQSTPSYKVLGSVFKRGKINAAINFLVNENYAKILAKPKLLTKNGKKAKFLVGGEIPLPSVSSLGQATIEWKKYGVNLEMEPRITKQRAIEAELRAEVSNLDYANAVNYSAGTMPAIRTRWAKTTVTIEPENTIVIAGLIQNEESEVTDGVPVLSGIPLIGGLFQSTYKVNKKTELVIFVTPKILGRPGV